MVPEEELEAEREGKDKDTKWPEEVEQEEGLEEEAVEGGIWWSKHSLMSLHLILTKLIKIYSLHQGRIQG